MTYRCNCSRQRMERNLLSLGLKDLEELAREQDETELVCHFCETKYRFQSAEIQDMIKALKS